MNHQMHKSTQAWIYAAVLALLAIVVVIVPALGVFHVPKSDNSSMETVRGKVLQITSDRTEQTQDGTVRHQTLLVSVDGQQVQIDRTFAMNDVGHIDLSPGEPVLLGTTDTPDGTQYYVADIQRGLPLWALTSAFVIMVMLIGGFRGLGSIVGMIASLLVIIRFIIPGILSGHSPVVLSIIGSLVILLTTLYLAHGVNRKTTVALVGTAMGLVLTGVLAVLCTGFFKLTGSGSEDASTLVILSNGKIQAEGLLLGSIIIGGLGVLADITIGQSSAVFELSETAEKFDVAGLFRRGMNVGKDHVAAIVNTLVLAYAGASLPLLIILATQSEPLANLLSREFMSEEIVRTLVPCIGILATVPLTTVLAAYSAVREQTNPV
jgi:uncharacterized membrane protein